LKQEAGGTAAELGIRNPELGTFKARLLKFYYKKEILVLKKG
jgi:hypothetical protein